MKEIVTASENEFSLCPGLGAKKVTEKERDLFIFNYFCKGSPTSQSLRGTISSYKKIFFLKINFEFVVMSFLDMI